jgi:hypothetical protein
MPPCGLMMLWYNSRVFDVNWLILYFAYGQVFFIMGLATALQLRG